MRESNPNPPLGRRPTAASHNPATADVDEGEHAGRGKLTEKRVRQQPEEREDGRSEGTEEAGERAGPRQGDLREHHEGDAASESLSIFSVFSN